MSLHYNIQLLILLVSTFCVNPVVSWWLYAYPEGHCSSLTSCQDCVVEYSYDEYNLRRPCTWCHEKKTCEMMNHYTGKCSTGATYRNTCPIVAEDMPRCVYFMYSFYFNYNSAPNFRHQCHQTYANNWCQLETKDKVVKICNADVKYLEPKTSGWGTVKALILSKNPYGLEINLNYDIWFNAGYGEDRRRIETEVTAVNDDTFKWLCQAAHQGDALQQAFMIKYKVTEEDPTPISVPKPLPPDLSDSSLGVGSNSGTESNSGPVALGSNSGTESNGSPVALSGREYHLITGMHAWFAFASMIFYAVMI